MENMKSLSPFRLASLLRRQTDPKLALQLFQNPTPSSPKPFRRSRLAYDLIICKLGRDKLFDEMERLLDQMRSETSRFFPKEGLFCSVITFYGRSRLPVAALRTYDRIPTYRCRRTIKSLNSLLAALLRCREFRKIHEIYSNLGSYDGAPEACTYNILINACCLNGWLEDAWNLFDEMRVTGIEPNLVTFGTLVSALCENSMLEEAFRLKEKMVRTFRIEPNIFIYTSLIKGLCKRKELDRALKLKNEMMEVKGMRLDTAVYTTLISASFGAARKGEVERLLEDMKRNGCEPDTVTYNAMISGLCSELDFSSAFGLLEEMTLRGCKPDVVSYNAVIFGLCREGRLAEASDLFDDMPRRGCFPDVVSYRVLFDALSDGEEMKQAAFILDEMLFKGFIPRLDSVKRFLCRLFTVGNMELLESVLCSLGKGNATDVDIWNMVINLVSKKSEPSKEWNLVDSLAVV